MIQQEKTGQRGRIQKQMAQQQHGMLIHPKERDCQDWQTDAYRGSLVRKLDEAIRDSGNQTNKTDAEMEKLGFQMAKSKDEYLRFMFRFILKIRRLQPGHSNNRGDLGQPSMM